MRPWLNRGLLAGLASGLAVNACIGKSESNDSPLGELPPTELCGKLVAALCAKRAECGCFVAGASSLCLAYETARCEQELAGRTMAESQEYDASAASQCVDQIATLGDEACTSTPDWPTICSDVFTGRGPAGAACSNDEQCLEELGCIERRCTALPNEGQACDTTGRCSGDLRCYDGVCEQALPAGSSCELTLQCATGLYCNPSQVCAARLGEGDECGDADGGSKQAASEGGDSSGCAEGLYCDYSEPTPVCLAVLTEGGTCTSSSACRRDFYCGAGGACVPVRPAGDPCGYSRECAAEHYCGVACVALSGTGPCDLTGRCLPESFCEQDGMCHPRIADGATCQGSYQCQPGRFCDTGHCAPWPSEGPCAEGTWCAAGLYCDESQSPATCQPRLEPESPCAASGAPCVDGHFCDTAAEPPACAPLPSSEHASCAVSLACGDGLYCDALGDQQCHALPHAGAPCTLDGQCDSVSGCASVAVCTPRLALGASCTGMTAMECVDGLACDTVGSLTCVEPQVGMSCFPDGSSDDPCGEALLCSPAFQCEARASAGAACSLSSSLMGTDPCEAGTYCAGEPACATASVGALCTEWSGCPEGQFCDNRQQPAICAELLAEGTACGASGGEHSSGGAADEASASSTVGSSGCGPGLFCSYPAGVCAPLLPDGASCADEPEGCLGACVDGYCGGGGICSPDVRPF